jgi:D-alanyl-D-alanine carboxypeptidase
LFAFDSVLVSKTGLTSAAGWCVSMVVEQNRQQYIVIVLGSKNKKERLDTVKDIRYNHVLDTNLRELEISATY